MKQKMLWILAVITLMVALAPNVLGVCLTPLVAGNTIAAGTTTLCGDSSTSYFLNTSTTGSFYFPNSNVYFDCNNTKIYNTGYYEGGYGFYLNTVSNITIVNCTYDGRANLTGGTWTNASSVWEWSIVGSQYAPRLWINSTEYPMGYDATHLNSTFRWYSSSSTKKIYVWSVYNPSGYNIQVPRASRSFYAKYGSGINIYNSNIGGGFNYNGLFYAIGNSSIENTSFGEYAGIYGIWIRDYPSTTTTSENFRLYNVTLDGKYTVSNKFNLFYADGLTLFAGARNVTYTNGLIKDWGHAGVYMLSYLDAASNDVKNNVIKDSYVSGAGSTYMRCFNIDGAWNDNANNSIYNNTCYNTTARNQINGVNNLFENNTIDIVRNTDRPSKTNTAQGIDIDCYNGSASTAYKIQCQSNIIRNNRISNTDSECLLIGINASDNIIQNNTFVNCSKSTTHMAADVWLHPNNDFVFKNSTKFINNSYGGGRISMYGSKGYYEFFEVYPLNITAVTSSGGVITSHAFLEMDSYNYKRVNVTKSGSAIVKLNGYITEPYYNDIKNITTGDILEYDFDNATIYLSYSRDEGYGVDTYDGTVPIPPSSNPEENHSLVLLPLNNGTYTRYIPIAWLINTTQDVRQYIVDLYDQSYNYIDTLVTITNNYTITAASNSCTTDYCLLASYTGISQDVNEINTTVLCKTGGYCDIYAVFNGELYGDAVSYTTATQSLSGDNAFHQLTFTNNNAGRITSIDIYAGDIRAGAEQAQGAANGAANISGELRTYLWDSFDNALSLGTYFINVSAYNTTTMFLTNISGFFDITANAEINITGINNYDGSLVNNYSVVLRDIASGATFNDTTTNGYVTLYFIKDSNFNISWMSSGIVNNSMTFETNETFNNLTLYMDLANSIEFNIFKMSGDWIENYAYAYLYGTEHYYNYTILNTLYVYGILTDTYNILFSNSNYTDRYYVLYMADGSTSTINVYFETGSEVDFILYDQNGGKLTNVLVKEYKFVNATQTEIASRLTDSNGLATFIYNSTQQYCFRFTKTGYTEVYQCFNPVTASSYDVTLPYDTSDIVYDDVDVSGGVSYDNETGTLTFTYNSGDPTLNNYSYVVALITNSTTYIICTNTSTETAGVFYCNMTGYTGNAYIQGVYNGIKIFFGEWINLGRTTIPISRTDGAFIAAIIIMLLSIGGVMFGGFVGLAMLVIGVIFVSWLGLLTPISTGIIAVNTVICIILLFALKRRN